MTWSAGTTGAGDPSNLEYQVLKVDYLRSERVVARGKPASDQSQVWRGKVVKSWRKDGSMLKLEQGCKWNPEIWDEFTERELGRLQLVRWILTRDGILDSWGSLIAGSLDNRDLEGGGEFPSG